MSNAQWNGLDLAPSRLPAPTWTQLRGVQPTGGICGGRDSFYFFADNPAEPAYLDSPGKSDQRTPLVIASAKDLTQANFGYSEYVAVSPKPAQLVRLRLNRPSAGPVGPKMDAHALTTLSRVQELTCRKGVVERLPELCGPRPNRRR